MADEEAGNAQHAVAEPDGHVGGYGATPKAPGWYPDRASPNDQSYWDGQNWTARRRWNSGKGWLVAGDAPEEAMRDTSPPISGPRLLGQSLRSGRCRPGRRRPDSPSTWGCFLLLVCGIALMYGSVGAVGARQRERRHR